MALRRIALAVRRLASQSTTESNRLRDKLPGTVQRFSSGDHPTITVDTSGLYRVGQSQPINLSKEPDTPLGEQLKALIQEALTNSPAGYYMNRDVFGKAGDFTTSPEISQLFGEMVGIWTILQWQELGSPPKLNVVEIGPGRGTLMADLLRGTKTIQPFASVVQVHLVEVSEALRNVQKANLTIEKGDERISEASGVSVNWHRSLEEVPDDAPAVYICHEFFDALPVHRFQKTERGWREVLVDVANSGDDLNFRMVLAPLPTPASRLLVEHRLKALDSEQRESLGQIEISSQAIAAAEALAKRVAKQGGAALIIDYGQDSIQSNSLRAIKDHNFTDPLSQPGKADLSCWVDFSALRQGAEQAAAQVAVHGPIPQAHFLGYLGIEARLKALLETANPEEADSLVQGVTRLMSGQDSSLKAPHGREFSAQSQQSAEAEFKGEANAQIRDTSTGQEGIAMKKSDVQDGMGYSYKVMAITSAGQKVPFPFAL